MIWDGDVLARVRQLTLLCCDSEGRCSCVCVERVLAVRCKMSDVAVCCEMIGV